MGPIIILGIVFCVFIIILIIKYKTAFKLSLIVLVFDGAIRKWLLPQYNNILYFLKDFILLFGYIGFFLKRERSRNIKPVGPWVKFFIYANIVWII